MIRRMRVYQFNSAIVRLPGRSVINGLRAHAGPAPVFEEVRLEHATYVAALRAAGVRVTVLEALEQFPDAIFVEDPALVFSQVAILLRPGAPSRSAEADALAAPLAARFPALLRLDEGHVDGGDILVTPHRVLIGLSARTDERGAAALQRLLAVIGIASETVRTPLGTLHLKSDCALIDDETVLAMPELAAAGLFGRFNVIAVPPDERAAANAVRVNDAMFVRADCRRTADLVATHGLRIVPLPVTAISRIDAGLSCMSLRWWAPQQESV
jgi:dimethylargininase